ncbi:MAG: elongation factor G [Halanaerobiales bacterium]
MSATQTKKIRNLCLISHGGAGKTTLTEYTLANAGVISEVGTVEDGNTKSDFTPEEKNHQFSVNNSYFSFDWKNNYINLIDTPGYADFRGEVASALRMVEGSVLLIDGTAGIEVNTNYVWNMAEENKLPRFVFINKMDLDGADFEKAFDEIKNTYEGSFIPLTISCGAGENYQGIVDLLKEESLLIDGSEEKKEEIPANIADKVEEMRMELIESIVELDEGLMEKYFADEKITDKELINGLVEGVAAGEIIPVLAGSAVNNSGLKTLMDYLVKLVPSPEAVGSVTGAWEGEEVTVEVSADKPAVAIVGKTMVDPYIGKLSIFKVKTGTLTKDKEVYIPREDTTVKLSKLYKLNGEDQDNVEKLIAGEIGAVAKLDILETSDTLTEETKLELEPIDFPTPMLTQAAFPASEGDDEKMSSAINRISQEDPTFTTEYNRVTKQLLVTAMGTVHFDIIKDLCKRKFDAEFVTEEPKVAYKETFQRKVEVEEKYKKQSGGRGQYGHVMVRLEPLPRGKGFEFDEEIFGGAIPNQYIPAVEKGIVEAKEEGVVAKYPVVDFKAVVYDGSFHPVDSSEMAFKIAASKAFRQGMEKAKPVLLEPIMEVSVTVPEEYMGDIMGDMNSRRGRIQGMEPVDGHQIIKAEVPQAEMFSYSIDLKSITGGHGNYTMELAHYDKVPTKIAEEIIEAREHEE